MTRDRSLDDFVGGESGERDGSDGSDGNDDADADAATRTETNGEPKADEGAKTAEADAATGAADSAAPPADSVDPAVGTYRWDPDGAACADCGETVERLWLDGDEQVCEACKEW